MQAQQPRVTVAIPTRNRADLLRSCLKSVLDQSLQELEVHVSDNASTDDTAAAVASFDDPRVHYAPLLEEHPSVGFVHSAFLRIGPSGKPVPGSRTWAGLDADTVESGFDFVWRAFQRGGLVCPPSVVMRRAAVLGERFEVEDGAYCDNGLWLRIARAHDVGYLTQPLSAFRVHADSQTVQYGNARVRRGRYLLTPAHAAAVRLPNERFLSLPGHDPQTVRELRALLATQHRRLRLGLRLQATLPRRVVRMLRGPRQTRNGDGRPGILDPEIYYGSVS